MSYVLSVIHPPVTPAAFGKAEVWPPVGDPSYAAETVVTVLLNAPYHPTITEAREFAHALKRELPGTQRCHTQTGLTFRIDPADTPPNACPCCGRLVAPEDAMFAGEDDTLCDGCYTWYRTTPQCLPANTAHTEEPTP